MRFRYILVLTAVIISPGKSFSAHEFYPVIELNKRYSPEESAYSFTLKDAIKRAVEYNRSFLSARDGLRQSELGLTLAESNFWPKLTPSFTAETVKTEPAAGSSASTDTESYSLALTKKFFTGADLGLTATTAVADSATPYSTSLTASITQPLLRGAGPLVATAGLTDAKRGLIAQNRGLERTKQQLMLEVISSYHRLADRLQRMDIAKKSLERLEKFREAVKEKYALTPMPEAELDVLRAEIIVSNQKQALIRTKEELGNEEDTFKVLLGLKAEDKVELLDHIVYKPLELSAEEAVNMALENRPDYVEAKDKIKDLERHLKIRHRDLLPSLSAFGRYKISQTDDSLKNSWDVEDKEWAVGVTASYTFPNINEKVAVEQQEITIRSQKRLLEEMRENIAKEVKVMLRSVTETRDRIEAVSGEVDQTQKRLELTLKRYAEGIVNNFEVTYAEDAHFNALNSYSVALSDHMIAQARVKAALGILAED